MLTYRGTVPPAVNSDGWGVNDIADLGLNRWVLLESKYNAAEGRTDHRAAGVYAFGKWVSPIAPAVWQAEMPGATLTRDTAYLWRAPNVAPNPSNPPLPPQKAGGLGAEYSNMDSSIGMVKHHGPSRGMGMNGENTGPGTLGWNEDWIVLDGSPTRWANIRTSIRYQLGIQGSGESLSMPLYGVLDVNGQTFEVPGWKPWNSYSPSEPTSREAWIRDSGSWVMSTYWATAGINVHQMYAIEVGLGSRYAVAIHGDSTEGQTWVVVADRTRGTARYVTIPGTDPDAGPLVRGNTAIFYVRNYLEGDVPTRVLFDLVAMTWKFELLTPGTVILGGIYAPSYFSDVPRIVATADGSGTSQRRVECDSDSVPIASGQHISYSGNNIILRVYGSPSRGFQSDGPVSAPIEVVTWSPDSNLDSGDSTRKGYFQ